MSACPFVWSGVFGGCYRKDQGLYIKLCERIASAIDLDFLP